MKGFLVFIIVAIVLGAGFYLGWFNQLFQPDTAQQPNNELYEKEDTDDNRDGENMEQSGEKQEEIIGTSAQGHNIVAYHFGTGEQELLLLSDIHGGYSWNTALLGFEFVDYFNENSDTIPQNITITVIPVLNPDGLDAVVGTTTRFAKADVSSDTVPGRFNGNGVDLNRNFDCNWQEEATWRDNSVDAGAHAFSEPEAAALRKYVEGHNIVGAVVWYSAAGGVYASKCNGGGVMPATNTLMNVFAAASDYPAKGYFDAYAITGDAVDWLAKQEIPAVSVLLETHNQVEWEKNRAGVEAVIEQYRE